MSTFYLLHVVGGRVHARVNLQNETMNCTDWRLHKPIPGFTYGLSNSFSFMAFSAPSPTKSLDDYRLPNCRNATDNHWTFYTYRDGYSLMLLFNRDPEITQIAHGIEIEAWEEPARTTKTDDENTGTKKSVDLSMFITIIFISLFCYHE